MQNPFPKFKKEPKNFPGTVLGLKELLSREQKFSPKRNCPFKLSRINKQQQLFSGSRFSKH